MRSAYDAGFTDHPQREILRIAPDASYFVAAPIGDCWFFTAEEIKNLPAYIDEVEP